MSNPEPFWPVIDRHYRHVRSPDGWTVIPFHVIRILICIAAVLVGVEATFGVTNWVTIPAVVVAIGWSIDQCDRAAITHRIRQTHRDHEDRP